MPVETPAPDPEIKRLQDEIAELKRQWPRHSVSPALLLRLEELEDALVAAEERQRRGDAES